MLRRCLLRSPILRPRLYSPVPVEAKYDPHNNTNNTALLALNLQLHSRFVVGERYYARNRRKKLSEEHQYQGEASDLQKKWKWSGWVSTKRDVRSAVEECVRKIRPHFEGTRPDVCFVWSSHENVAQLKKIPSLLRRTLSPRFIFGRFAPLPFTHLHSCSSHTLP